MKTETLPDRLEKSTLVQLYKGRGYGGVLDNMRHIHMKDEVAKFCSDLVFSAAKEKMFTNITTYQIYADAKGASRSSYHTVGHSAQPPIDVSQKLWPHMSA